MIWHVIQRYECARSAGFVLWEGNCTRQLETPCELAYILLRFFVPYEGYMKRVKFRVGPYSIGPT